MNRARTLLATAAFAILALAGCADDDDTTAFPGGTDDPDPTLVEDADTVVIVEDNDFELEEIEVSVGDTVGWAWQGDNDHNVVFDDGPASPIQDDGTWIQTFDEPGTYPYVCTLHSSMTGTVTVTT